MIQRIQTVFLALVVLSMIFSVVLPHWTEISSLESDGKEIHTGILYSWQLQHQITYTTEEGATNTRIEETENTISILVLGLVAVAIAAYTIFQYKNRMRQVKLSAINTLMIGGTAAASIYYSRLGEEMIDPDSGGVLLAGIYLPAAALVFNMLARMFILKDERLVKDSDRIR